jgi:hypothetical protein
MSELQRRGFLKASGAGLGGGLLAAAVPAGADLAVPPATGRSHRDAPGRRARLYELLGDLPDRQRPVSGTKRGEEERDGYVLESWVLDLNGLGTLSSCDINVNSKPDEADAMSCSLLVSGTTLTGGAEVPEFGHRRGCGGCFGGTLATMANVYDRLTNGLCLSQFLGYTNFSNSRRINFYAGLEFMEGFTKNRRNYNFDTAMKDDASRLDFFLGFKLGWIIPLYKKVPKEYYYD